MISVTSENEQDTILNLTETELEGISGGWDHGCDHGHDYGCDYESDYCDYERYCYHGSYYFHGGDCRW
jgi:hypothetical protein